MRLANHESGAHYPPRLRPNVSTLRLLVPIYLSIVNHFYRRYKNGRGAGASWKRR